ncbi:alpha/beta hydrolase [uncultured Phenylobacterium sp.]|uniref:alpha/beta hydrolase n=1 Tax=uncultured Phenylobacterium sp. TaxID=349273 RepID=UPI0025EA4B8D|nr:alpha/beta hydrolase [uncultured Phenylobacterium sp.]
MPSKHLVDPQILPLTEQMPGFELSAEGLPAVRAAMLATRPPPPPLPDDLVCYEVRTPGRDGAPEVRLVVTAPKAAGQGRPGVLHVHGGGYILGSPEMTAESDRAYAREFGAVVVSVDYRLAPETPHPGPVEDCYAGLDWLHREAEKLGVDRGRIAVTGESAGGGLAAALVLLARERAEIPIAFQHLVFPMLDDRTVLHPEPSPYLGQFVWTRENNHFGWSALLGCEPGGPDVSPFAAPARATDLAGLPPTFIICGALDLFLEENLEYARRLIRAGVPTELHVYPGAPHAFMFVPDADISRSFARDSMAALGRALKRA